MPTPVVAHYISTFLPLTEGWLYDQLRYAEGIRSLVLAKKVVNARAFTWPSVYSTRRSIVQELGRGARGFYPLHARACRRAGAQLLHAHFGNRAAFARRLAAHLGVPLVASFYGRDLATDEGYEALFREGQRFLAEGPAARQRLIELGCPPGKIRIHRLGVNPDEIEYHPRRRRRDEPLRLLMAGRFVEKKGFIHGLRAFCRAAELAPVTLTIVGDAGNAPAEREIKEALHREARCAPGRITFHTFLSRDEFVATARAHHLLLQPSVTAADGDREGGHPVVLTLLAAGGMPSIATRHCDIPEIVVDGETGWLCDERDEDALVRAILAASETDLESMSGAARRLVETKYDIRRERPEKAYEGLI